MAVCFGGTAARGAAKEFQHRRLGRDVGWLRKQSQIPLHELRNRRAPRSRVAFCAAHHLFINAQGQLRHDTYTNTLLVRTRNRYVGWELNLPQHGSDRRSYGNCHRWCSAPCQPASFSRSPIQIPPSNRRCFEASDRRHRPSGVNVDSAGVESAGQARPQRLFTESGKIDYVKFSIHADAWRAR